MVIYFWVSLDQTAGSMPESLFCLRQSLAFNSKDARFREKNVFKGHIVKFDIQMKNYFKYNIWICKIFKYYMEYTFKKSLRPLSEIQI